MSVYGRWSMTDHDDAKKSWEVVASPVIQWVKCKSGEVPKGAVVGGMGAHGEVVYIGRTRLRENQNELMPGVVVPSQNCILLSFGAGVRRAGSYEVLVSSDHDAYHWVACQRGHVPDNAVVGGSDCSYFEPLYIGRTDGPLGLGRTWRGQRLNPLPGMQDLRLPGKIHRTHKCLYIPFMEKEYLFRHYEALALKWRPAKLASLCRGAILRCLPSRGEEGPLIPAADEEQVRRAIASLPLPEQLKVYCERGDAAT